MSHRHSLSHDAMPLLALKVLSEFVDVAKAVGVLQSAHAPVLRIFGTLFMGWNQTSEKLSEGIC